MGDLQSPGFSSGYKPTFLVSLDRACKIILVMEKLTVPKMGFPGIVPDVADAVGQMAGIPHKSVKIIPVPECA